MNKPSKLELRQMRTIGHGLNPIVTVGGNGLSESVLAELDRALDQHELIKVKLAVGDREARKAVTDSLCEQCGALLIQSIGNVVVILRRAAQPDPKLSNLIRPA